TKGSRFFTIPDVATRWRDHTRLRDHPRLTESRRVRRLQGDAVIERKKSRQRRRWRQRRSSTVHIQCIGHYGDLPGTNSGDWDGLVGQEYREFVLAPGGTLSG